MRMEMQQPAIIGQITNAECAALNIKFIGLQKTASGSHIPMFNCLITGTTFLQGPDETMAAAAARSRQKWGIA